MQGAAEKSTMAKPKAIKATKNIKEKKAMKEKKTTSAKPAAAHPTYFEMISEALKALKERGGSSSVAIAKYIEQNHSKGLPDNFKKMLSLQLKNSLARGKLVRIKASYKLAPTEVKKVKPAAPKKTIKKSGAVEKTKPAKKPAPSTKPKKPVAVGSKRKAVPAKPKKTAKPKSLKSPAAKRVKKA